MIVGNGLIAKSFQKYDKEDVLFFASGVSNSLENDIAEFKREEDLIKKKLAENPEKTIVYFSTCSIYDSSKYNSSYVLHKLNMENVIEHGVKKFLICRVSNAVGKGGNPHLLINYLVHNIKNNIPIIVHQKATRNLIDVEDVSQITLELLKKQQNTIQNVAYPENFSILELVSSIEKYLAKQAVIQIQDRGESYTIDTSNVFGYFKENKKRVKEEYIATILKKYY